MRIERAEAVRFAMETLGAPPDVAETMASPLARIVARRPDWTDGGDPASVVPARIPSDYMATLRHARDWIASSIANGDPWLSRRNRHGEPVKLAKIVDPSQLAKEADKSMRRFAARMAGSAPSETGEELHADLGDGWSMVRLETPEALDRESGAMGHCIGEGGYDRMLGDGRHLYLSLRDPAGRAHATLEIDAVAQDLVQCQGKQNRPPIRRHADRMKVWLAGVGWMSDDAASRMGFVRDVAGKLHSFDDMPDDLEANGDLVLPRDADPECLPRRSLVLHGGMLHVRNADPDRPARMPESTRVDGTLRISGTVDFPEDAVLEARDLVADGCRMLRMPSSVRVERDVWLRSADAGPGCASLVAGGRIHVHRSMFRELPERVHAHGVAVHDTTLSRLPSDLRISEAMFVSTGLASFEGLPTELETLHLDEETLPPVPSVRVRGSAVVVSRFPALLPDGWHVGSLKVAGGVDSLPGGLRVDGDLDLSKAPLVATLPADLVVGGGILGRTSMPEPGPEAGDVAYGR